MLKTDGYEVSVEDPNLKQVKTHIGEITFAPEPAEQMLHDKHGNEAQ